MYNVILFADTAQPHRHGRSCGIHKIATELRSYGLSVLCVNYCGTLSIENYEKILDYAIGSDTYFVGFSTTWFPYKLMKKIIKVAPHSFSSDYNKNHAWYYESLAVKFVVDSKPIIDAIKKRNFKTKVVVGGPKSEEYIADPYVDYVLLGFSEAMTIDLALSLSKKGKRRIFNKVLDYDVNSENGSYEFRTSVVKYIDDDIMTPGEVLNIEFSRGCIFSCTFCSFALVGRKNILDHIKFKETIYVELLENYEKYNITSYNIADDTFNDNVYKLKLLKEVVDMLPFTPNFWAYVRIDLLHSHPEMIQLLSDIGVKEIFYGLETLNEEAGKVIKKGNTAKKLKSLKMAKEAWQDNIYIAAAIIVGLPKESRKSIEDTFNWYYDTGHTLIDNIGFVPLILASTISSDITTLAPFDKDLDRYFYKIESDMPNDWTKHDGTDITSSKIANEIIEENYFRLNDKMKPNKNLYKTYPMYRLMDSRLTPENIDKMTYAELIEIENDLDRTQMYKDFVDTHYWPKLFEMLEKKTLNT